MTPLLSGSWGADKQALTCKSLIIELVGLKNIFTWVCDLGQLKVSLRFGLANLASNPESAVDP